jgi:hypothetical protein
VLCDTAACSRLISSASNSMVRQLHSFVERVAHAVLCDQNNSEAYEAIS